MNDAHKSDTQKIIDWIYRTDFGPGDHSWDDILLRAARLALGKDSISAESYAENSSSRQWNYAVRRFEDDSLVGITVPLEVVDRGRRILRSQCFHLTGNEAQAAFKHKILLRRRPRLLRSIDSLTPRQFEALGCALCRSLGATRTLLTRSSDDSNVDFFASLPYRGGEVPLVRGLYGALRVVGQSKKYNTRVAEANVEQLSSTLENIRRKSQYTASIIPDWFYSATGPIVGCIVGHVGFQSGAIDVARSHGITLLDSIQVAEILSLSRVLRSFRGSPSEWLQARTASTLADPSK